MVCDDPEDHNQENTPLTNGILVKHKTQEEEHSHDMKTWRYEPTSQGSSKENERTNPHHIPSQEAKNRRQGYNENRTNYARRQEQGTRTSGQGSRIGSQARRGTKDENKA